MSENSREKHKTTVKKNKNVYLVKNHEWHHLSNDDIPSWHEHNKDRNKVRGWKSYKDKSCK